MLRHPYTHMYIMGIITLNYLLTLFPNETPATIATKVANRKALYAYAGTPN